LRKQNCRPVKRLGFGRADRGYRDGAERRIPESEGADQQNEQDRRAPDIADAERAVEEVGHRRADRRRRDDHRPIQERVEFLGSDLSGDQRNKDCRKDHGADEIAEIQRHRDGVAAGLAERGRGDLDDPEAERDFRDFA
jgi:hypothetical protein